MKAVKKTNYRLRVTPKGYLKNAKRALLLYFFIGTFLSGTTLLILGKSFESMFISSSIEFLVIGSTLFFHRKIRSAAIKDGFLLMKTISGKSKVTSLRSIKNLRTRSFLGMQLTKLRYNLDGGNHTGLIITIVNSNRYTPEEIIRRELHAYEEFKKKANLKPGPVSAIA